MISDQPSRLLRAILDDEIVDSPYALSDARVLLDGKTYFTKDAFSYVPWDCRFIGPNQPAHEAILGAAPKYFSAARQRRALEKHPGDASCLSPIPGQSALCLAPRGRQRSRAHSRRRRRTCARSFGSRKRRYLALEPQLRSHPADSLRHVQVGVSNYPGWRLGPTGNDPAVGRRNGARLGTALLGNRCLVPPPRRQANRQISARKLFGFYVGLESTQRSFGARSPFLRSEILYRCGDDETLR